MSVVSGISKCYSYCFGTILICICFLYDLQGQATGDLQEDFLYGEYYIEQGLFQEALPFYLSCLKENPENSNINYRIGFCYMKIIGVQQNAIPYLEKAVVNVDEHYIEGRYKDPAAPIEAWLLLGDVYHRENELLKASFAYHQYKKYVENSNKQMLEVVIKKINNLGISLEYQRFEQNVRIINLGERINSRFSDYNPVLSGDQMTLVYTQFWETFDRILITHRTAVGWSAPESLNEKIGSEGNCYTSALSYDGTELYIIWHYALDYDIYVTNYVNGEWTKMVPVSGKVNSRNRESSVSISSDGKFLYFSSDRPGGEGGFDIYRAERESNEWTNIINLGEVINTQKNEEAPYITFDGTVLFLSSNGHESVGNMDILFCEMDSVGNWTTPVNVGLPVNTTKDDIFYVYFPATKTGYLARDLAEGYGKNDLYRIQIGNDPQFIFNDSFPQLSSSIISNIPDRELNSSLVDETIPVDQSTYETQFVTSDTSFIDLYEENIDIIDEQNEVTAITNQQKTGDFVLNVNKVTSVDSSINSPAFAYSYIPDYSIPADSIPTYTIQLFALRNWINPRRIELGPLVVTEGDDSLFRYTYGEYIGYSKALEHLDSIRKSGFPDAFIRNIASIHNYTVYGSK